MRGALHSVVLRSPFRHAARSRSIQKIVSGTKALLSKEQQAALARIKRYSDFNDLATQSRLGREGLERQVKITVNKAIEEAQQKQQQRRQQTQRQRRIRHAAHI